MEFDLKQVQIIETALKRFAHFGISKTTMNEIADDLSSSKASLYYYFPDKSSLILAVIEHLLSQYQLRLNDLFKKAKDLPEIMYSIIHMRGTYAKEYFMLHIGENNHDVLYHNPAIRKLVQDAVESQRNDFAAMLQERMEQAEIRQIDVQETATLILDTIQGLQLTEYIKKRDPITPDEKFFEQIEVKQKAVCDLIYSGIKK